MRPSLDQGSASSCLRTGYDIGASTSLNDDGFYLHEKRAFQRPVQPKGFAVLNLYGDYSRAAFEEDKSPFMIWVLQDKGASNNCVERTR